MGDHDAGPLLRGATRLYPLPFSLPLSMGAPDAGPLQPGALRAVGIMESPKPVNKCVEK